MNVQKKAETAGYYREGQSWATDRERQYRSALRIAWLVAGAAGFIAVAEAFALIAVTPLKTVVPYTLLVDRQTGFVEALNPTEKHQITPDSALTRSFLAQYVSAREGFQIETLKADYRKVALWSAGEARAQYIAGMQSSSPDSPLATLSRRALVEVRIRGISALGPSTSLVRYDKVQIDPGGQPQLAQPWSAIISYQFSNASMSAADRLVNPLGFQVVRYRRNADVAIPAPDTVQRPITVVRSALPSRQALP